jgi:putative salt-induced outer membrane protein YdiY
MPRKPLAAVLLVLLAAVPVFAADSPADTTGGWSCSMDLGLVFNQSGYSDSWAGDELGQVVWTATANMLFARNITAGTVWRNTIKLLYGQTHQQKRDSAGAKHWAAPEKSTDRIFVESLLRFSEENWLNPYAAVTLESQFQDDLNTFLSPALITESAGVGRQFIDSGETKLFSRLGAAFRQRTARGMDTVTDGGLESVTDLTHKLSENLQVVSKLRLFKALDSSIDQDLGGTPQEDDWKAIDVAWETTISAQVSKVVQTSLFVEWLYDKEISRKGRYREIYGFGITYKLF